MAVDTKNKRRSVIGLLPIPDGMIGPGDRAQVAGLYRGFFREDTFGIKGEIEVKSSIAAGIGVRPQFDAVIQVI